MFIDEVTIKLKSGKGGDGQVHFRREKFIPRGGPDGGDGGRGGNITFEVKTTLNTLSPFRYTKQFQAADGKRGGSNNQTGHSAEDLTLYVPPGTVVYDQVTGELIGDLVEIGQHLLVVKGGRGGRGNARFANSRNQAPRIGEKGEPGLEREIRLELKLIADIGIVGVPNAGKSTFLSVVTNAKPKIAPYPFTTLEPNLGVAELDDELNLVLADIPGLIEGAHLGLGLGHEFLRHIQRTRVLIHLLDGLAEDPLLDYSQINSELSLFDPGLAEKPQVVALNKIDLPEVQARWPGIEAAFKKRKINILAISAVAGTQVKPLLFRAAQLLKDTPLPSQPVAGIPVYRLEATPEEFTIERVSKGWRVSGKHIERAAAMTYWEYFQSIRRFQRILKAIGVEDALRNEGIRPGDIVFIGEYELEWQD